MLYYRLAVVIVCTLLCACYASGATCTNPAVRKEWRKLTHAERAEWIRAVKCLTTLPHTPALAPIVPPAISQIPPVNTSGSYLDDIVYVHMDLNTRIHFTGFFLPWHRFFVSSFESDLKEKCAFTGASPYWNWSMDASDVYNSPLFKESNTMSGLGGWGNLSDDTQISTGGFASGYELSYPSHHRPRRNFTLEPFSNASTTDLHTEPFKMANTSITTWEMAALISGFKGDYKGFHAYLEAPEGAHSSVHEIVRGDLGGQCPGNAPANCTAGPTWSANEPLFWLHHAMIDKIWYDWQHYDAANAHAFEGGSVQMLENRTIYAEYPNGAAPALSPQSLMPTDGMWNATTIGSVMNTTEGFLCYVYE
ncbi:hypothetical protein PLICRDRAFT_114184 [Plicaturopsis crispa FD-325 SS-3]|nr:hypothetical protein PLICRDRAFT_114184 [Plicaturopsis crispa FD-325 SS-3]